MRYIIRSGLQVYQAATPQDALALGEQMAAEGMEDVWMIDEGPDGRVISSLETLRYALKDVVQPSQSERRVATSDKPH
ncbi:hypothetical protein ACVIW2_009042 [Bradyrhizobium huanghuaihaiense]|uniref:Uncharacterized protein n=1 Tax=Bradyrhizobium huanghuaihaiense TaxID=990078 RepID=A0A562RZS1_9BRAD|nr:hypothetical protein [Bradyrhizobium huanghuaihaiense]TWI73766.1 hypothetical protein IQ16_01909 [Bradyrhizobium huanghuaihaiense]